MYKVKLTRVKSNHNNLRTDEMIGMTDRFPTKGKTVEVFGEGLVFGMRLIHTTPVKEVEVIDNEYLFHTKNSTYKLEVLKDLDKNNTNSDVVQ